MSVTVAPRQTRPPGVTVRKIAKLAEDPLGLVRVGRETAMRRAVADILEQAVAQVSVDDVEEMIARPKLIDRLEFEIDTEALEAVLLASLADAGKAQARRLVVTKAPRRRESTPTLAIRGSFDLTDPRAVEWARTHAADLVVEITESTRQSLRDLIARATAGEMDSRAAARAIRPLIGLHTRWSNAVLSYRTKLEATGTATSRVESLTSRYYNRLLTTRSRTIARTETLSAANQGKFLGLLQAQEQGLLPATASKVWIAAADAEQICAALDGTAVGLHENFVSELGEVPHPPLHPSCRCTIAIENA